MRLNVLLVTTFVAGLSSGLTFAQSIPFGFLSLILGLGIVLGGVSIARQRGIGIAAQALADFRSTQGPRHERLFKHAEVWFPLGGEWTRGKVIGPVTSDRSRYEVWEGWSNLDHGPVHVVEWVDLRLGTEVLTEPAPVMTVPEMEAQIRAERGK